MIQNQFYVIWHVSERDLNLNVQMLYLSYWSVMFGVLLKSIMRFLFCGETFFVLLYQQKVHLEPVFEELLPEFIKRQVI